MAGVKAAFWALWSGHVPLARAFWEYTVLYGFVLNLVTTLGALGLLIADASAAWAALVFLLPVPYNLFMVVAVWRSADRYTGPRRWADLARVAVILWAVLVSIA